MTITYYYPHKDKVKLIIFYKGFKHTTVCPKHYYIYDPDKGYKIMHYKAVSRTYFNPTSTDYFIDVSNVSSFAYDCSKWDIMLFQHRIDGSIHNPTELYLQLANMCWDFTEIPYYLSSFTPL